MVSLNTELYPSGSEMHGLHSRLKLSIVYGLILVTVSCVILIIHSYSQPMRTSTTNMSKKCRRVYKKLDSIAWLEGAILEFGKSAFVDLSSSEEGLTWYLT